MKLLTLRTNRLRLSAAVGTVLMRSLARGFAPYEPGE